MSVGSISLFSGAGGLDVASVLAGVPLISSTDFEHDCIETLKANEDVLGIHEVVEGNIKKIDSSTFKNILDKSSYEKFIIIGGAPCQPFSSAGNTKENAHKRGVNDPRASLISEYLRMVKELNPDGFVFENVPGLLFKQNKSIADDFIRTIEECGYKYKLIHANALDYGVPQARKRIFIIGTKGTFKTDEPIKTHSNIEGDGLKMWEKVIDHIGQYASDEYYEPEEDISDQKHYENLCKVPAGDNYTYLTAKRGYPDPQYVHGTRFSYFLKKLHPDGYSNTVATFPAPMNGPLHWDNRRLRVPEIAAIQTFPKGYKFCGNRRSIQRQIGNAVPCLMGKAMIEFVRDSLT